MNCYEKFVDNLSIRLAPLHQLLQKDAPGKWETQQIKAFEEVKQLLAKVPVLGQYNPGKPFTLATDASPYGIGITSHFNTCSVSKSQHQQWHLHNYRDGH